MLRVNSRVEEMHLCNFAFLLSDMSLSVLTQTGVCARACVCVGGQQHIINVIVNQSIRQDGLNVLLQDSYVRVVLKPVWHSASVNLSSSNKNKLNDANPFEEPLPSKLTQMKCPKEIEFCKASNTVKLLCFSHSTRKQKSI